MSRCQRFDDAIWEAAHGRAAPPDLAEHLRVCESCRRSLRSLSAAAQGFAALRSVSAPDPRPAVWARVAKPRRRGLRVLVCTAGIAICGLAVMMLLWYGLPGQRDFTPRAASTVGQVSPPKRSSPRVEPSPPAHQVDVASAGQELREQRPRPSAPHEALEAGKIRSAAPEETGPAATPAGIEEQATPEVNVEKASPAADQASVEPTTDESSGKMGAFVNRTLGMALAKTLLVGNNGTG